MSFLSEFNLTPFAEVFVRRSAYVYTLRTCLTMTFDTIGLHIELAIYTAFLSLILPMHWAMASDFAAAWPSFVPRQGHFTATLQRAIYHHTPRGDPEPPNILLVVDFSTFISADEFTHHDFDEDIMLNAVQLMSLHGHQNLQRSTVEDLKVAAQQWLWNPLGLNTSTSDFVLVILTENSLEPHWHGKKVILHFQNTWQQVLQNWQIPITVSQVRLELWNKMDIHVAIPRPIHTPPSQHFRSPVAGRHPAI